MPPGSPTAPGSTRTCTKIIASFAPRKRLAKYLVPEDLEGDDVPFLVGNVRGHVDLWIRGVVQRRLAVRPRADRQRAVLLVVREVPERVFN
jgi:hypothetical protein